MTDENLLAELGLSTEGTATEATTETTGEAVAEKATRAPRVEIKINKTSVGLGLLPARVAFGGGGGPRGSKYPFADLVAPAKDEAGNVTGYAFFDILLTDVENADEKKLQGAIQAAVAQQNKQNKADGSIVRYVSRTKLDESNAYVGSSVYRVDDTVAEDDAK